MPGCACLKRFEGLGSVREVRFLSLLAAIMDVFAHLNLENQISKGFQATAAPTHPKPSQGLKLVVPGF